MEFAFITLAFTLSCAMFALGLVALLLKTDEKSTAKPISKGRRQSRPSPLTDQETTVADLLEHKHTMNEFI